LPACFSSWQQLPIGARDYRLSRRYSRHRDGQVLSL